MARRNHISDKDDHQSGLAVPKQTRDKEEESVADSQSNVNPFLDKYAYIIQRHEQCLKSAKDVGDRKGEGEAYRNLGNIFYSLAEFQKAIDYHEQYLTITKEVGDKAGEGKAYGNLGINYDSLGDFRKAADYHERHLGIAKEVGDKAIEGKVYCNLANVYRSLGEFQKAIDYNERHLVIAEETGDRAGEGIAYGNLGAVYLNLGQFRKAIEYIECHIKSSKEVGDRAGEGTAYGNLGNAYRSLGEFPKAIHFIKQQLKIAKEVGDRPGEGNAYGNLGNVYTGLGDFRGAAECYERHLKIAKEVGDRLGEGKAYGNLSNAYRSLGEIQKAIDYSVQDLKIAKQVGARAAEAIACSILGNAYRTIGEFQKAIEYHEQDLMIAIEVGDRAGEGKAWSCLGNSYTSLGEYQKAIEYHERGVKIKKEVGDKEGEGSSYGNLGNAYRGTGNLQTAIDHYEMYLKIAKEIGDRAGEGAAYGCLGNAYDDIGDFQKVIEFYEQHLKIAKEVGDRIQEGKVYSNIGSVYDSLDELEEAIHYYENSVKTFNHIRSNLISNDEWKISLRNTYDEAHSKLWRLLLKQGKVVEALLTADQGRAQALNDLLETKYGLEGSRQEIGTLTATTPEILNYLPSNTIFIGINEEGIIFWVNERGKEVRSRRRQIDAPVTTYLLSLLETTQEKIGVNDDVYCEDRSLRNPRDEQRAEERVTRPRPHPSNLETNPLQTLYNIFIDPIRDLLQGDEVVLVPESPLFLAPFAAFMDRDSKYLCESFRIRLLPSLSSLQLISNCPDDWHSATDALLVGDPWVEEVGRDQLEWAEKEVKMIGEILQTEPLIGKQATKDEVLRRISSVALVHIAAHGQMETGEIALAPNLTRSSPILVREDYVLTMKDVLKAQIRARLVVLSCCHSARGDVKAEGVVGIARAFLGAGARSVLVSLWAIDDEATMEFMKHFYRQLVNGRRAGEALNEAMKSLRESKHFSAVKYWAPFVLIGDDVTLEF